MEISENKLETISTSYCRVGKISSSRSFEEDNVIPETDFKKEDLETLNETANC